MSTAALSLLALTVSAAALHTAHVGEKHVTLAAQTQ